MLLLREEPIYRVSELSLCACSPRRLSSACAKQTALAFTQGTSEFADPEITTCQVCHLRNDHTKDVASAEPNLDGAAAKYSTNACCAPETANAVETAGLYGPEYVWQRCYNYHSNLTATTSAEDQSAYNRCARWLVRCGAATRLHLRRGVFHAQSQLVAHHGY